MDGGSRYSSLYKNINSAQLTQEERRRQILDKQKEQRSNAQDNARGLKTYIQGIRGKFHPRRHPPRQNKEHKLQFSEWLKSRPEDLDRWFLVPCPKGQRCLVIATEGRTEVYNKRGYYMYSFRSHLPGSATEHSHITVLDCVYIEKASTFFVLDVMAYSNIDMLLCEAQFRFFWIKSKLLERPELSDVSEENKKRFIPLNFYDFEDEEEISSCFSRYPQFAEDFLDLDGFLFYHKDAGYVQGRSPLVGWLYAFMIPEVLRFKVHPEYVKETPSDYVDCFDYMTKFDKSLNEKRKLRRRRTEDAVEENMIMDVIDAEKELEIYGEKFEYSHDNEVE